MNSISLDCLLAVNFCLDYIALRLCATLLKSAHRPFLPVAAVILALLECLSCVFPARLPSHVLALICFSIVALLFSSVTFALLYSCASLWAGIFITFMMKFFKGALPMNETAVIIPKIDAKRLSFALTALVCLILLKLYFDKKERRPQNAALEVAFAGKKVRLLALRDSGNLLRDPLSGRAVAVISKKAAEKLGANEQSIMKRGAKMRVIPVKSVGHTGILYAFIPDTALIDGKKQNICIALDQKNRDFSGFDAIIPSNM